MKRNIIFYLIIIFSCVFIFAQNKKDALVLLNSGLLENIRESIQVCESELKENPNNIDSYVVMCWGLVANKEYARAEQMAYEGLKLNRADQRLIEVLGEAKYFLGKSSEALKQFQEYISLVPYQTGSRVGRSYYFMGEIYIGQTKFQHADIAFSAAVRKEPREDKWWVRTGYAREMARNYYEAIAAYDEALKLNSGNEDAIRGKERVVAHIR